LGISNCVRCRLGDHRYGLLFLRQHLCVGAQAGIRVEADGIEALVDSICATNPSRIFCPVSEGGQQGVFGWIQAAP